MHQEGTIRQLAFCSMHLEAIFLVLTLNRGDLKPRETINMLDNLYNNPMDWNNTVKVNLATQQNQTQ